MNMTELKESSSKNAADKTKDPNEKKQYHKTPGWVYVSTVVLAIISYVGMPHPLQPPHGQEPSIQHVFYYGWLTAISTGLGAIPLAFFPDLASFWVGISNGEFDGN